MVLVRWAAADADAYRVVWKPSSAGSGDPVMEAGLVTETQLALTGLPRGTPIVFGVSARNGSGETAPVHGAIVVP